MRIVALKTGGGVSHNYIIANLLYNIQHEARIGNNAPWLGAHRVLFLAEREGNPNSRPNYDAN